MKLKNTIIQILGLILVFGMFEIAIAQTPNPATSQVEQSKDSEKLEEDLKRFDTDGDGTLSGIEREEMLNTMALEAFLGTTIAQQPQRERRLGNRGFRGGRRGPRRQEMIADRFDMDKDAKLNDKEKKAARDYIQESRGEIAPSRPSGRTSPNTDLQDDLRASKAVKPDGKPDLYDEKTLRTLYLRFPNDDWYEELGDFYRTDIDVQADLVVDGKVYRSVGVRFRGSSSYFGIMNSEKKSLNIAIDSDDENQRLYGYKTLNLLNGHSDPSFIREVLYSKISREYLPAPKVNFVKLMINGENWGIYINAQQFNKDFLAEWFGNKDGVRWKVPPGRDGGLVYNGEDSANYQSSFQLKTKNAQNAWNDLIRLCKILDKTPDDRLEKETECRVQY